MFFIRNTLCIALLPILFSCQKSEKTPVQNEPAKPANKSQSLVKEKPPSDQPYLVVLGTTQDAGYPQAACKKDCCAPAWQNEFLRQPVTCLGLVDPISGEQWMFEATPDFPQQLADLEEFSGKNSPENLNGIFLTHGHIGHYTGLIHLGREVMGADKVPVFAMPRMRQFLSENGPWSQLVSLQNIALQPINNDSTVQLNERISVTPILVPHRDEFTETVGFRVQGPNKAFLFIPDIDKWEKWDRSLETELKKVDYAFLDATFFANGELPGRNMSEIPHPFVEETAQILSNLPPTERKKVQLIHFNHTNPLLQIRSHARDSVEKWGMNTAERYQVLGL